MYITDHSGSGLSAEPVGEGLLLAGPLQDLKFTYCFCAHMHEIVKYFILTEIQKQCLFPSDPLNFLARGEYSYGDHSPYKFLKIAPPLNDT